ncbi:MAG: DUF3445 domain-containing protein [Acidimicrobiales bacterium]
MTVPVGPGAGDASSTAWIDEIAFLPDGPPWLSMGLGRVDEDRWLLVDQDRPAQVALRRQLLAERHDEVFAALDGTEAAGAEVLGLVRGWLERRGVVDEAASPAADGTHPLEVAGMLVQEDLALMVPRDGRHHLDAAVLCFPSHWRLRDKLGGSALAIHGPVPRYEDELAARVDRFLERLAPDVVVARRNWTVHPDDALFSPDPPVAPAPVAPDRVASSLVLRSERQTLRRLPETGVVLFTIRVQQAPFGALAAHPSSARDLAARLRGQPAALTAMNGLAPHLDAVLPWLDGVAKGTVGERPGPP